MRVCCCWCCQTPGNRIIGTEVSGDTELNSSVLPDSPTIPYTITTMGIEIDLQWDDSMEVFCIGGDSTIPCILPKFSKLCASLRRFLFVVWAEGTRSMAFEKEYRSRRTEFEAWFTKSLLSLGLPLQAVCLSILSSIQSTVYLSFKC